MLKSVFNLTRERSVDVNCFVNAILIELAPEEEDSAFDFSKLMLYLAEGNKP